MMIATLKKVALNALSIFAVLFGAYYAGGRSVRKKMEMQRLEEANRRINATIEVRNDVEETLRAQDDAAVAAELRANWMRR